MWITRSKAPNLKKMAKQLEEINADEQRENCIIHSIQKTKTDISMNSEH